MPVHGLALKHPGPQVPASSEVQQHGSVSHHALDQRSPQVQPKCRAPISNAFSQRPVNSTEVRAPRCAACAGPRRQLDATPSAAEDWAQPMPRVTIALMANMGDDLWRHADECKTTSLRLVRLQYTAAARARNTASSAQHSGSNVHSVLRLLMMDPRRCSYAGNESVCLWSDAGILSDIAIR